MLDGLLGRGFSSKCKSLIKATRTRIEVLRRRKEATQRFLKGNLAQLLSNGLDINAFGRTEEFLSGLNSLACYDFLEQSCEYILKKLSMMQKHSECPEECREVVGSLMFAAARFSDLPELRDLRDALQERYGNSLEHFVNQKFVERLVMKTPTIEKKIQLLQDIALELSIKWDSRGFHQRMMANPSTPAQDQAKKQERIRDYGTTYNLPIDNEIPVNPIKPELLKARSELSSHRLKAKNGRENYVMSKDELGQRSFGGVESTGNNGKRLMGSDQNIPQGRQVKNELSSDGLQSKNGWETFNLRNEHNTNRRDCYDHTLVNGDVGSYATGTENGRNNNILRKDEQGDSMDNRSCKLHIGLEKSTPRREDYGIGGELNSDGLRAKHGRINYLTTKDEMTHLSYQQGDSTGNSLKPHFDSDKNTVRRDIYNIGPLHGREQAGDKNEPTKINVKEDINLRRDGHGTLSCGKRPDSFDEQNTKRIYNIGPYHRREPAETEIEPTGKYGNEDIVHRRETNGSLSRGKRPEVAAGIYDARNNKSYDYNFIAGINELPIYKEENTDKLKPKSNYALPPPYVKSKDKLVPPPYMKSSERKKVKEISHHGGASMDPTTHSSDNVEGRSERLQPDDFSDYGNGKDVPYRDNIPLPKPRSIRRKHSRSSNYRDDLGDSEDSEVMKRSSSSRRRDHHHSKKGLQILFDEEHKEKDDEERKIDKLLIHYSKKQSTYDEEKARREKERKVKPHAREALHNGFNRGEASNFPTRSVSLPREQINSDEVKIYARANSFQPDKPVGHVHPKLPDYDDLAAQFAALKGR